MVERPVNQGLLTAFADLCLSVAGPWDPVNEACFKPVRRAVRVGCGDELRTGHAEAASQLDEERLREQRCFINVGTGKRYASDLVFCGCVVCADELDSAAHDDSRIRSGGMTAQGSRSQHLDHVENVSLDRRSRLADDREVAFGSLRDPVQES